MRRNAVKVCVRTRPTHQFAQDNITIQEDQNLIQITQNHDEDIGGLQNNRQNSFKFKLDHIFHNASQATIYDMFARDTVQSVVDGINGAILTYGQTGSGKTFTMMGDTHSYEHRGIAPRALGQIFHEISSRVEYEYRVSCTYLELYGEKIFDLLKDLSNANQDGEYILTEERDGRGIHVRGLNEVPINNENDALNLLFSGELCKTIAQHKLNRRSNRSHSIFTVYIQQRQKSDLNEKVIHSKLHLVDLAGSERLKKTLDSINGKDTFDEVTKKESMAINQSLTYLEQCVVALARKSSHIPYRQSKLTNILKDTLGANCNTLMIACIWGESSHLEETISTLRLASRMMKVENETSTVETIDSNTLIKKQAKLIKALKQELLMHDALVERTGIGYEPYTPEQQLSIRKVLESYVDSNEIEEEEILFGSIDSYRKVLEVCKQFKKIIIGLKDELKTAKEEVFAAQYSDYSPNRSNGINGRPMTTGSDYHNNTGDYDNHGNYNNFDNTGNGPIYVGEDDNIGLNSGRKGFGLGTAPSDSTPSGPNAETLIFKADSKYNNNSSNFNNNNIGNNNYNNNNQNQNQSKNNGINRHVEFSNTNNYDKGEGSDGSDSPIRKSLVNQSSLSNNNNNSGSSGKGKNLDAFIRTDGAKLYEELTNSKKVLKELKSKNKECVQSVNQAKIQIDELQTQLNEKKSSRIEMLRNSGYKLSSENEIIDEEEFNLMKELKEVKRTYKNRYEQLNKLKLLLNNASEEAEYYRNYFANSFASWSLGNGITPGNNSNNHNYSGKLDINTENDYKSMDKKYSDDFVDQLDDQEAFEKLEMERVVSQDPDSLAFFNAQKTRRAHVTQNGSTIRQIHKNKRLG